MCIDMCTDMCMVICMDMCMDMCMHMCMDMCIHMWISMFVCLEERVVCRLPFRLFLLRRSPHDCVVCGCTARHVNRIYAVVVHEQSAEGQVTYILVPI